MPLNVLQGLLGLGRAAHLLRRATFGPTIDQINQFAGLTATEAIEILFDEQVPDPVLPINPETGTGWLDGEPLGEEQSLRGLTDQLILWLIGLAADTTQPVSFSAREKIVFFLHTHFTTKAEKVSNSRYLYYQNQLFRHFAFDRYLDPELNFRSLINKVSLDNAMLRFLDGSQNVKGSPNENYGRELMELYAIGRGLEGSFPTDLPQGDYVNYTEQDVQAAARVLSGLKLDDSYATIDPDTNLPTGRVAVGSHDNDDKQFSNRFNDAVIAPDPALMPNGQPTPESVLDEIAQMIDMITEQREAALYICRKLYRFFVYHEISEDLQNTVISDMADTFIANNYKLQPVIEELLQSEHFYEAVGATTDDDKFGAIIKSPLDLVVGTLRFFNIQLADYTLDYVLFYDQANTFKRQMDRMGMNYYEPFEVAGYTAYHQFPAFNRNWISSNYLANRYDFISGVFMMMSNQNPDMPGIDIIQFTKDNFTGPVGDDAKELIKAYITDLFPVHFNLTFDPDNDDTSGITAERLSYFLKAFLFEPQIDTDPEAAWTTRWTNNFDPDVVEGQLLKLMNALLQTPEYQLM